MVRSIVSRTIASRTVASRRIATAAASNAVTLAYATNYGEGSYTFTAPYTGTYRFTAWGGGGGGTAGSGGGGGGALAQVARFLRSGQTVALVVAAPSGANANGSNTTVTLPDGSVITAGGGLLGSTGTGGTATGGDTNVSGGAKSGGTGGTGASLGSYRSSAPSVSGQLQTVVAAGGADGGGVSYGGGPGLVLIIRES